MLDHAHEYCKARRKSESAQAHFVVAKLVRTTGTKLSTLTTVTYKLKQINQTTGADEEVAMEAKCNIKLSEFFDGLTVCDYINNDPASWRHATHLKQLERFYNKLGRICNQLFVFLKTQQHLVASLDRVRSAKPNVWHLKSVAKCIENHLARFYPEPSHPRRVLVMRVLDEYRAGPERKVASLPEFVIHSDFSTKNLLVDAHNSYKTNTDEENLKICIIDFQDIQTGPQATDLANLALYCVIEQEQMPFETALTFLPRFVLAGYQSNTSWPLASDQIELLPILMKLRLCQSLLNGQAAHVQDPDNSYVMHTNQRGWQLLELLCSKSVPSVGLWTPSE